MARERGAMALTGAGRMEHEVNSFKTLKQVSSFIPKRKQNHTHSGPPTSRTYLWHVRCSRDYLVCMSHDHHMLTLSMSFETHMMLLFLSNNFQSCLLTIYTSFQNYVFTFADFHAHTIIMVLKMVHKILLALVLPNLRFLPFFLLLLHGWSLSVKKMGCDIVAETSAEAYSLCFDQLGVSMLTIINCMK